jgi:hypothetical protein
MLGLRERKLILDLYLGQVFPNWKGKKTYIPFGIRKI